MDAGCQESGEQGSRAGPVGGVGGWMYDTADA